MIEPIVTFNDVHKSFGDVKVLKGIDLDIKPAEKVAIIGPSGSGKTTIIRMLMTLEQPTSGDIIVDGKNLWKMEKKGSMVDANEKHLRNVRGDIGMVFQHFNLFPHMTILENCMTAPIHVKNEDKSTAKQRSIEMLEKVGLGDKLDNYPSQLSGGQKQRVAMARALVMRPKVMLFDEVTSALDPELVGEVLEVIRDIAKEGEMAMILVTHEMDFALDVADKVLFLDEGVIAEQGTASEVIEHSTNERLQSFLHRFRS
ncbi:MAG: ectoine/hydroxyectoine ABC transporter ATP-binding protein EhuA [Bacillota bacterium]|uniref:Ectoine/hydroxyectoine ABC transporter ATP-binding protein EhuA n=1 Tax=Virgibacillus salarius TaxID=447199 RepID=A0A941ICV3_9BACI|nr:MULTISPECIES: ectoine/hydroxyectoine ABC transporter ATP-binding protein EhuA [Bacillaceae]NAZ10471.1 ectoine/hydroxyectoine ABC transporter ATP-binding protein EhuA [Agaribacter marinus]MBR7797762.1 ectoine/hydroxyectoine ABC transporter ATP-binding protein EhuA [Virgibacillus salarius]MCC2252016.1 ectoine/hydroxyectoine ABC transporter ATP-binding protein EhuA [Virgibacillus sp. AGTR]MDY7046001.1 ectoine/hydroxyectoine ABC transporter ATP-binding protein EhuA [Virgibacillus sp. M23]QRZ195